MLFTIIRDFFVKHVWGGISSDGITTSGRIGRFVALDGASKTATGNDFFIPIKGLYYDGSELGYINFCDWLSTTSAIITMVLILICIAFFIRWIFKVCSNAILLR